MNGESHEVTSSSHGNLNSVLGALGTASFLGLGANNLGRGFGWGCNYGGNYGGEGNYAGQYGYRDYQCSENQPVTRYDAQQMIALAAKDAEIANLRADKETDKKLVEVYAQLAKQDNQFRDRLDVMKEQFTERLTAEREARLIAEKEQAVFNQSATSGFATIKSQIAQMQNILGEITTNVVPQRKVCDTGCGCCQQ